MEKPSLAEFYQKYCRIFSEDEKCEPAIRNVDVEFFNMIENAKKEGKNIIINKNRTINWDSYIYSLTRIAMQLTEGNKIQLISQKPDKFTNDLKKFFNIDVKIKPTKIKGKSQNNSNIITIKNI